MFLVTFEHLFVVLPPKRDLRCGISSGILTWFWTADLVSVPFRYFRQFGRDRHFMAQKSKKPDRNVRNIINFMVFMASHLPGLSLILLGYRKMV